MTVSPLMVWLLCRVATSAFAGTSEVEQLLRRGSVAEALEAATQTVRAAPQDLEARELYVDLLVATGQGPRALREVQELAKADPANPAAHYLVGRVTPEASSAQAAYEAALRLSPTFPRAHMGMAAIHEARGKLAEAEAAYGRAIAGDPELSEAWLGRVRILLRLTRSADALAVARQGLAACPSEPGLALVVAELAPKEAEATLKAALARIPDEPRLHEAHAELLLERGDAAGALKAAEAALAIDPSAASASRTALIAAEIVQGRLDLAGRKEIEAVRIQESVDPKGALSRYPALVQRYPRSALVRLASGAARSKAKDPGALDELLAAVSLDPHNVEASGAAGLALLEAGRAAEALPLLQKASIARPWDPGLGLGVTRALAETQRKSEAMARSADLARQFRFDAAVQVAHAGLLVEAGKPEEAYQVVRQALLVAPDPRLAAAFVRIAPLAGHPEEAAAMLDQIVAQTGNPALAEAARKLREQPRR